MLARLSEAILDGRLPAGGALPSEARLAENFGVSKQVVREAIRQLAALGVLEIGQGRATRVRAMDAEPLGRFWRFAVGDTRAGLAEAVELRRIIEPQVARLAARRAEAEGLAALEAALARMRAAPPGKARWKDSKTPLEKIAKEGGHADVAAWSKAFHLWQFDWTPERMEFRLDGRLLNTVDLTKTVNETPDHANPFHEPHSFIVNLAIGGTSGGDPSKTPFPARLEVDWIRVWQCEADAKHDGH